LNKKVVLVLLTLLLLNCCVTLFFRVQIVNAAPTTIDVPNDYTSIQTAINAANNGDVGPPSTLPPQAVRAQSVSAE
jgi:hypothetical protein